MKEEKLFKQGCYSAGRVGFISTHVAFSFSLPGFRRLLRVMWINLPGDQEPVWTGQGDLLHRVLVLTNGLIRSNSPRCSNRPIMMEMVTRIIMCKLLKSSCPWGFRSVTPPIFSDSYTNAQSRICMCCSSYFFYIYIWFNLLTEIKTTSRPFFMSCKDVKIRCTSKKRREDTIFKCEWCEWKKGKEWKMVRDKKRRWVKGKRREWLCVTGLCNNLVISSKKLQLVDLGQSILLISVNENIVSPAFGDSVWSLRSRQLMCLFQPSNL